MNKNASVNTNDMTGLLIDLFGCQTAALFGGGESVQAITGEAIRNSVTDLRLPKTISLQLCACLQSRRTAERRFG